MPPYPTDPAAILDFKSHTFKDTPWAQALERGDADAARAEYVRQLRTEPARVDLDNGIPRIFRRWVGTDIGFSGGHHLDPDMVCEQRYIGCYGVEHQFKGEIDWLFDPTQSWEHPTREWQVQLNRHYQWVPLADRYRETKDPKYARAFERELRSWVRQCPRPDGNGMALPGCWRLIEVGIRAGWTWPYAFETFRHCPEVTDEAIWLMACALHEHGMHLLLWPTGRNFKTMESNGLLHVGAMFPAFRLAGSFFTTGLDRVIAEMERQVYPDGMQDELAPSYGMLALANFYSAIMVAKPHAGFRREIPRRTLDRLGHMVEALGILSEPDGRTPPLHDSPSHSVDGIYKDAAATLDPDRFANRPWEQDGATHVPWAGYAILRREGRYAMLDAGPWGSGHQHADALQLLANAYGRRLLIDSGKPIYNQSPRTIYMRGSASHNVVQMDSLMHRPEPRDLVAASPWPIACHEVGDVSIAAAHRSAIVAAEGNGAAPNLLESGPRFEHRRIVLDVAGLGWIVRDELTPPDDKPHTWEWLWHTIFDAIELRATDAGPQAIGRYDGGPGLAIIPLNPALTAAVASGQTDPRPLGWWSAAGGSEPDPCRTVIITHAAATGSIRLWTLLLPLAPGAAAPTVTAAGASDDAIQLTLDGKPWQFGFQSTAATGTVRWELPGGQAGSVTLAPHRYG